MSLLSMFGVRTAKNQITGAHVKNDKKKGTCVKNDQTPVQKSQNYLPADFFKPHICNRDIDIKSKEVQEILFEFRKAYIAYAKYVAFKLDTSDTTNYEQKVIGDVYSVLHEQIFPWFEKRGCLTVDDRGRAVDVDGFEYKSVYQYLSDYEESIIPYLKKYKYDTPEDIAIIESHGEEDPERYAGIKLDPDQMSNFCNAFLENPLKGLYPKIEKIDDDCSGLLAAISLEGFAAQLKQMVEMIQPGSYYDDITFGEGIYIDNINVTLICPKIKEEDKGYPVEPVKTVMVGLGTGLKVQRFIEGTVSYLKKNSTDEEFIYAGAKILDKLRPGVKEPATEYLATHRNPFQKEEISNPNKEEMER